MEQNKKSGELSQKMMEGLRLAVSKLTEQSIRDNQPLVVSIDGKIQKIYPKKAS
ncbi:MAG TPA: hypothetical protein VN451_10745 [Chitinophagaceae bacterium]|nr:hypothetical protein [Chitinophagaceae bacterium]